MSELELGSMTVEEALAHHGVKGMKWGVRKAGNGRYPSGKEIRTARKNVNRESGEVLAAKVKQLTARGEKRAKAKEAHDKLRLSHLNNPDRVTALKLTKGETALHALLLSTVPVTVVASVGTREVLARNIQRQQENKSYNKRAAARRHNDRMAKR